MSIRPHTPTEAFEPSRERERRVCPLPRGSVLAAVCAVLAATGVALASPASADAPPPSWTNERVLTCDGQTVGTYLTPAGWGTPFIVADSSDVIIPKYVEVVFSGGTEPVVTLNVPGFDPTSAHATHCEYVDPVGLKVDFWGLRS